MAGSTISTFISTLTIGPTGYPSPVTITGTGGVVTTTAAVAVQEGAGVNAVLVNEGTISGPGVAVDLQNGGFSNVIMNSGLIEGSVGVKTGGLSFTTVVNQGTIIGADSAGQDAILVGGGGGMIDNAAGGFISAATGINNYGELINVVNAGTIIGGLYAGEYLTSGDTLTNLAGGSIIGAQLGVEAIAGVVLVVNQGTISGGADAVHFREGFASTLVDSVGAVFDGIVDGGNTLGAAVASTLELAAGTSTGTLAGLGTQFVDFAVITLDPGATWAQPGTVATGENILFSAGAELDLADPGAFAGEISGFARGDTLDLTGATFAAGGTVFSLGGNLEAIVESGQTYEVQFDPAQSFAAGFTLSQDVGSGVDVTTIACFLAGTRIATAAGAQPVETLRAGDIVRTATDALRVITWIGHRTYGGRFAAANPDVLPITVLAGALADGIPARDLSVSPKHAMLLDGVLVPAELLVNGVSVVQVASMREVSYHHIELDSHDILLAEGAPSESFVDRDSRLMFYNAPDFVARYGAAPPQPDCAPRIEDGAVLAVIRQRLAARAGLAADHAADAPAHGPLDGRIDTFDHCHVGGWAFDATRSHTPVALELLVDGVRMASGVANAFRADLRQAGKGEGRCAFRLRLSEPLPPNVAHRLEVRRANDGNVLATCRLSVDPSAPGPLDGRIDHCNGVTVEGWALDTTHPGTPVRLEVMAGGKVIGEVLANRYRPDLAAAGPADGWCSFVYRFDSPPADPGAIRVRRASDHVSLPNPILRRAAA